MPILGIIASQDYVRTPPSSYESIATVTVGGGGSASVTLSSIPSTYTHLQIRATTANTTAGNASGGVYVAFNSDTTNTNYRSHYVFADGSSITASQAQDRIIGLVGATTGYGTYVVDILDYANTNKYKTVRSINGFDQNTYGFTWLGSTLWVNTNTITSMTFTTNPADTFLQYTKFSLYGIKGS